MIGSRTALAATGARAESLGPELQEDTGRSGCQSGPRAWGLRPENKIQLYMGLSFEKAGTVTRG